MTGVLEAVLSCVLKHGCPSGESLQGCYALSVELSRMVRWDTSRSVVRTILYRRNYIPLLLQGGKVSKIGKVCNGCVQCGKKITEFPTIFRAHAVLLAVC